MSVTQMIHRLLVINDVIDFPDEIKIDKFLFILIDSNIKTDQFMIIVRSLMKL